MWLAQTELMPSEKAFLKLWAQGKKVEELRKMFPPEVK